jgi:mannonate dehydratase
MEDPPINDYRLLPSIINHKQILKLFQKVSSKNFGLSFCLGTRYESGMDILEQIRVFGALKKIFHIHFRNVRGTIPSTDGYEEVAIDDGDIDMLQILKHLKKVGYDGAINPDHFPLFLDDPDYKASLSYTVGYVKGLMVDF